MLPEQRVLDRLVPPDFDHVQEYPLSAAPVTPKGIPVVWGINWYPEFDRPVQINNGEWWIAKSGVLSTPRGGHCIASKANEPDPASWWTYYNQGREGACVGFGDSRMKSLLDRQLYDAFEAYHATQALGGYVGQEGAFVRDCMALMCTRGLVRRGQSKPDPTSKISAYRWATTVDEVLAVLNNHTATKYGAIPWLNSWGRDYPHLVWLPGEVAQRLINENGEVGIVTDA